MSLNDCKPGYQPSKGSDFDIDKNGSPVPGNAVTVPSLYDRLKEIYIAKNNDYGGSFDNSCDRFGPIAAIVRMNDKLERLISLTVDNKQQLILSEPVEDTAMDLANYSVMLAAWIINTKLKNNR